MDIRSIKNTYKVFAVCLLFVSLPYMANGQKWAVSTNTLQWLTIGTINAECAYSIDRHFTIHAGGTANPFDMDSPTGLYLKNRQFGGYVGARYWPWHVYSEWWVGAKLQYKNFEHVGLLTPNYTLGEAVGAGISGGYSCIINKHFNVDFGIGVWGGRIIDYTQYKGKVKEGKIKEQGAKNFFYIDNIMISLVYIF